MANADQLKHLIKAHINKDDEKFKTIVLQIAAHEATIGHASFARELRDMVLKAQPNKGNVLKFPSKNTPLLFSPSLHRLSDLVAGEDVIFKINRIIEEFYKKEKLRKHGLSNRRKILLEGAPGTGKTMTADIIATELKLPLQIVQMDKLVTKFMGETSMKLREIFDNISEYCGVYLFDEFDAIGANRSLDNEVGEMRRVLNSFLQFLEQDNSNSIIIAATNNKQILDNALFRRFDDVVHYDYPDKNQIALLISKKLSSVFYDSLVNDDVLECASKLSHADIARACEDALKYSILSDDKISTHTLIKMLNERQSMYVKKNA